MAGRYSLVNIPRHSKNGIVLNPSRVPDGMILRRVLCDEKGLPTTKSHLDLWDGDDGYIPDVVEIPEGMEGVEDGRNLRLDHSISCTLTYRREVHGIDSILPNVGVFTIHDGKSRQIGMGEGEIEASWPKNLIVFPTLVDGMRKGNIRIWKRPDVYCEDRPVVKEIFLPNWDNGSDNVLKGAYLGRDEIVTGETTAVVGSSTVPVKTDLGWLGFGHSATSIQDPERYYEQRIFRYDPKNWKKTGVTRMPVTTILDCPVPVDETVGACGFPPWVPNAAYILGQEFNQQKGEIQFLTCFRDCLVFDGHLTLEEIESEMIDIDPDKPFVAESAMTSLLS